MTLTGPQQALVDELKGLFNASGSSAFIIEQVVQQHSYYIERDAVLRYEEEFKSLVRKGTPLKEFKGLESV